MPSTDDRLDLVPREEPGGVRSFIYALVVHLLLAAALTWGVSWKSKDPTLTFEVELYSSLPEEAAPPLEAPPPPPPEPVAAPAPTPAPAPPPKAEAEPEAEIAIEREKKRKADDKKKALALAEKAEKAEKAKKIEEAKAKAAAQAKLEAKKLEAQKEQQTKKQAAAEAKQRKENMDRMNAQLGATGAADAKGSAPKASGPPASYGDRVRAKVKSNIFFNSENIAGNPVAEVEVVTTLDGTITSQRLVKPSGNKAWDEAVLKAIERTATLPRNTDGPIPNPMTIVLKPKD